MRLPSGDQLIAPGESGRPVTRVLVPVAIQRTNSCAAPPRADTTGAAMPGHDMAGHDMSGGTMPGGNGAPGGNAPAGHVMSGGMPGMVMEAVPAAPAARLPDGTLVRTAGLRPPGTLPETVLHQREKHGPANAMTPMATGPRLAEPGPGLGNDGWRVLLYTDLRALTPFPEATRPPVKELELHLTGNMERYMWAMNGIKFSDVDEPLHLTYGEQVRITMVNDTMMAHPMHIHGMWMLLENGHGAEIPRLHTINVKPGERVSFLATPTDPGPWAFHCHVLLHMELGRFRVVRVSDPPAGRAKVVAEGGA